MASLQMVTEDKFDETVAKGKVLIDFYADWCGPCKMMTPILEALAAEMTGSLSVYKLDVDAAQMIATKFDITSVPTLILFENGQPKKTIVGLKDLKTLKSLIA